MGNSGAGAGAWACPAGPFGAPLRSGVAAQRIDGVPPTDLFNQNGSARNNVEGAVWIGDALYVSEFPLVQAPPSRILKIAATLAVSVHDPDSGSNGLAVDADGNLVATNHKDGSITRRSLDGGPAQPIVSSYDGRRFNSPNDLALRSDGNIYFSDPTWQAPNPSPQTQTRVYRVAPGADQATVVDGGRSQPNGVTLSTDEQTLYVSGTDGIYSYPVASDGGTGVGQRINGFQGSADGLGMDCAGNLYVTSGNRVLILSDGGIEIGAIPVAGAESVTNVAFGGAERKTLFITAMGGGIQKGVWQIDLALPGLPY